MELDGQVIVITGAAQGLGQKMAEMVAQQGAKLALVDIDSAKLKATAQREDRGPGQGLHHRRHRRTVGDIAIRQPPP